MTDKRFIASLDIGTSKVCAFIFENTPNGLSFLGAGCAANEGVENGKVVDVEKTTQSIYAALENADSMAGKTIINVWVGVSGKHIHSLKAVGKFTLVGDDENDGNQVEVSQESIQAAIESAKAIQLPSDRILLHAIPQSYSIDNGESLRNAIGMPAKKLEASVNIITADNRELAGLYASLQKNDLIIKKLILEPLASSYSVLSEEEKESGVALVDIGAGTTDVAIYFSNALVHTSVIPFGGLNITKDIAQILHVTEKDAEELKLVHGTCFPKHALQDKIFDIQSIGDQPYRNINESELAMYIEARMEEILAFLHQNIKESGYLTRLTAGIVFTGGGSHLKGLLELSSKLFDIPIRLGEPKNIENMPAEFLKAEYSTAIGLAQVGLEEMRLIEEKRKEQFKIKELFGRIKKFAQKHF
jgi:cell division protein FtsA